MKAFEKYSSLFKIAFLVLLCIGVLLRIFKLGLIPVGLNADEASIGYEAYSLLKTGADRWGIHLPPYFLSFGSGQNTLYAYLSVPFLYFFDMSQTSIRLLSAVLGLLTIPIVYYFTKLLFKNNYWAYACTILYLFDPYLFMISRWALEYNILPFFVLVSLYLFTKSFESIGSELKLHFLKKACILFSLPSLALIIYAYASALFIVPVFLLFLIAYNWVEIKQQKVLFSVSFLLFLVVLSPFLLFILKNHVLKTELAIEPYLPFEIPKMLSNREEVYKGLGANLAIIKKNFIFIFSGFKEFDRAFNTTKFYNPHFFIIFAALAVIVIGKNVVEKTKKQYAVLFFWSISCLMPFLFFEMNLNRSVHLQAVIPILATAGLYFVFENLADLNYKKYLAWGLAGLFVIQSTLFMGEYFNRFPNYDQFIKNFGPALKAASSQKKPTEKISVTSGLVFNYLFVGFFDEFPPREFQKTVKANFSHANVDVHSFGNYIMLGDIANTGYYLNNDAFVELKKEPSFLTILKVNENIGDYKINEKSLIDSTLYNQTNLYNAGDWKVIRFTKK